MSEELVSLCAEHTYLTYPGGLLKMRLLYPFSPEINKDQDLIRKITNYTFKKRELLCEALYPVVGEVAWIVGHPDLLLAQGNRQMAMLGDTVMRTLLMDKFYDTKVGRKKSCSRLSWEVQGFITNEYLCRCARGNGDQDIVARYYYKDDFLEAKALATTVEAVIGAVWLDSDKNVDATLTAVCGLVIDEEEYNAAFPQTDVI